MESINVTLLDGNRTTIRQLTKGKEAMDAMFKKNFTTKSSYIIDISSIQSTDDTNYAAFNTSIFCREQGTRPITTHSSEGTHTKESVVLASTTPEIRPSTPKSQTKTHFIEDVHENENIDQGNLLPLIAGLGGGGFILVVTVVILCVILNRRRRDKTQVVTSQGTIDRGDIHHDFPHLDNAGHGFQPLGNDSIYDHMATSRRLDSNKGQETGRSSDDPTYDHTGSENIQQISTKDAPSGDVYACVVKAEKKSHLNDVDIERQIGPKGDLYTAVVMKKE